MRWGWLGTFAGVLLILPALVWADGAWLVDEPDRSIGEKGIACDLAADGDGRLHASYWAEGCLCYAAGRPGNWTIERVADVPDLENHWSDIEVGPDGTPQIVYYDFQQGGTRYAYHTTEGWETEAIGFGGRGSEPYQGFYCPQRLVVTPDGVPHIRYMDSGNLYHAWREDGVWMRELIRAKGTSTWPGVASVLAKPDRELHMVYTVCQSFPPAIVSVVHAWLSDGAWHSVQIEIADRSILPCFALDSAGRLQGVYRESPTSSDYVTGLWRQWEDDRGWHTEPIDPYRGLGVRSSLVLDSSGSPSVAYNDYRYNSLKYAWHDGRFWHPSTVDADGNVGEYCAMVLIDDWPYIAHYDDTHGALKLTWRNKDGWHNDWIDMGGDLADHASIYVGDGGYPVFAYDDVRARDLRCAWQDGDGFHAEVVDATLWQGRYPSVCRTPAGEPAIAYLDYYDFALKYAVRGEDGWEIEVVDDVGYCGFHASLIFAGDGRPRISYCEYPAGPMGRAKLKYAWQDEGGWHTQYVDSQLDPVAWADGPAPVMVLGPDGKPWIVYQAWTLKFARQIYGAWAIYTIDAVAAGRIGMAVDPDWRVHLSYADAEGHVTYAQVVPGRTLDEFDTPLVGYDTCLALGPDARVHIAADDQYGVYGGETWETELLPGPAKSFALDAAGHPHVAFRKWVEELGVHTLGYAHKGQRKLVPDVRPTRTPSLGIPKRMQ